MSQRATRDTTTSRARAPAEVAAVPAEAAASVAAAAPDMASAAVASSPPKETAAAATTATLPAPLRETVLGNCALCGSGDKLKFCSRCNAVRYCGPACQKDDVRRGQRNKSLNPLSRRVFSSFLSGYMTFNLHINIGRSAGQVNPYAPTRLQRPSPGKGPSPSSDADGPLLL